MTIGFAYSIDARTILIDDGNGYLDLNDVVVDLETLKSTPADQALNLIAERNPALASEWENALRGNHLLTFPLPENTERIVNRLNDDDQFYLMIKGLVLFFTYFDVQGRITPFLDNRDIFLALGGHVLSDRDWNLTIANCYSYSFRENTQVGPNASFDGVFNLSETAIRVRNIDQVYRHLYHVIGVIPADQFHRYIRGVEDVLLSHDGRYEGKEEIIRLVHKSVKETSEKHEVDFNRFLDELNLDPQKLSKGEYKVLLVEVENTPEGGMPAVVHAMDLFREKDQYVVEAKLASAMELMSTKLVHQIFFYIYSTIYFENASDANNSQMFLLVIEPNESNQSSPRPEQWESFY